jgi:EAL domain-containing protein (putative c-di-GMP-specific phosphodiesterase class I)
VATVDARVETQDDLLVFPDAALYRAKERGRNRMELFTPALRREIIDSRQIITDLHTAIERDQIEPYFQVQVDSYTQRVTGAEALMRWNHPSRGMMVPDSFLHLADKLRITGDLDRQMKLKTHQCLLDLRAQGLELPRISFNASAVGLRGSEIVENVKGLLDDGFGVALELLESIMVENEGDEFRFTLDLLRDIGIELEIDDFGSGRASVLGLLEVSPVTLKIDKRLIYGVETEASASKLVRAIVDIAEALDISTICEGVETEEQITALQALGCTVMQGYYYSRPVPVSALAKLLRDPPWIVPQQVRTQA